MYDNFDAGRLVDLDPFVFKSNRFEVWRDSKLIKSGNVPYHFSVSTTRSENSPLSTLHIRLLTINNLATFIQDEMNFDSCFFGTDRIIGATIPAKTNIVWSPSFEFFRSISFLKGTLTRQEKFFESNEPFGCSLFLLDGLPSKLTFSNGFIETLTEFYWD